MNIVNSIRLFRAGVAARTTEVSSQIRNSCLAQRVNNVALRSIRALSTAFSNISHAVRQFVGRLINAISEGFHTRMSFVSIRILGRAAPRARAQVAPAARALPEEVRPEAPANFDLNPRIELLIPRSDSLDIGSRLIREEMRNQQLQIVPYIPREQILLREQDLQTEVAQVEPQAAPLADEDQFFEADLPPIDQQSDNASQVDDNDLDGLQSVSSDHSEVSSNEEEPEPARAPRPRFGSRALRQVQILREEAAAFINRR